MLGIRAYLEPIAGWFESLGVPEPIVHWGHPAMMAIVVFVMGSYVAWAGWRGRTASEPDIKAQSFADHRQLVPWMFLFIALGYTGGVLSLVMQGQPIFESAHFWTGSVVLILLGINGLIALTRFGGKQPGLRTAHAYLGTAALGLLILHAVLGLQLGFSI